MYMYMRMYMYMYMYIYIYIDIICFSTRQLPSDLLEAATEPFSITFSMNHARPQPAVPNRQHRQPREAYVPPGGCIEIESLEPRADVRTS